MMHDDTPRHESYSEARDRLVRENFGKPPWPWIDPVKEAEAFAAELLRNPPTMADLVKSRGKL